MDVSEEPDACVDDIGGSALKLTSTRVHAVLSKRSVFVVILLYNDTFLLLLPEDT
jgi:hypothetical protein